jgi:hypothetical protein
MLEGEFAASSNGDKWFLKHGDASGKCVVIHQANLASRGSETSWPISSLLQIFGEHPQGHALREVLRDAPDLGKQASKPSLPSGR